MTLDMLERRATSAMSEAQLVSGGLGLRLPRELAEPCVCGGVIRADDDPRAIADAVVVHGRSTSHQQWRERAGGR